MYRQEIAGGDLWSPKRNANGAPSDEFTPGDIVLAQSADSGDLDDGSGGARIGTLACSKNFWEDFDERGGTRGGWVPTNPLRAIVAELLH
jgi:hypothetical protein